MALDPARRALGLRKVAPVGDATDNTTIDIIAIHGLDTESPRTWEYNSGSRVVNWLADSDMLPTDFPEARIFTYDWNANSFENAPVQTLLGHADTLLGLIAESRGSNLRPIIFIASCFGGLILAEAINRAAQEGSGYRQILLSTAGVVFLGTPFRGSDAVQQAQWQVAVGGIMGKQTSKQLIDDLNRSDKELRKLTQVFAEIARRESVQLPIHCFYETKPTEMLRKFLSPAWAATVSTSFTRKILVTQDSACLDTFGRHGLDAAHSCMNKFDGPGSSNFKLIKDAIRRFVESAPEVLNRRKSPSIGPSSCQNIPFTRNEAIVYRADIFSDLERLLPLSTDYQSAAVWGLGGSGKTQIALEYAYRRCRDPACSVFWVHADNETTFAQDYKAIAKKLSLTDNLDGKELLAAVRERIEANPCWVLVLDNADNLGLFGVGLGAQRRSQSAEKAASLYEFIPQGLTGTVLWTSRDERIAGSLVRPQRAINIARMTAEEATTLLETVRNKKLSDNEVEDARALLAELDWLPLAISQAAAYMRRTLTPIVGYLSKLKRGKRRWRILQESEFDLHRRPGVSNSILETWNISIEHIRQENEMAYKILYVLAFLDNQNIPLEIIRKAVTIFSNKQGIRDSRRERDTSSISESEDEEDEDIVQATTRLREFSFLSLRISEEGNRAYEIHKLVQDAARYTLNGEGDEAYFSEVAFQVIEDLFPKGRRELWGECEKYLLHTQRVGEWAELFKGEVAVSALLKRLSNYLYDRGRWREKEPVDKRTYQLRSKALGKKHPDTFRSMADLAATYHAQGRYEEAEKIFIEVLGLQHEVLGDKHPDTFWSMADLAAIYHAQRRYKEAEKIYIEVLGLRHEVLGDKHPDTLRSMADLAAIYHAQRRYKEAEKIYIEVLGLRREVLGDKYPDTIGSMADLAATYYVQGRYEEAEKIYIEVLGLRREVLGDKHPDTIWSMYSLARTWKSRRQVDAAIALMEDCFQLRCRVLGPNHPFTRESFRVLNSWKMR